MTGWNVFWMLVTGGLIGFYIGLLVGQVKGREAGLEEAELVAKSKTRE